MIYETGFILLFLVSVYKVPFLILVSVYTGCPVGGTRNMYPASYIYIYTYIHDLYIYIYAYVDRVI